MAFAHKNVLIIMFQLQIFQHVSKHLFVLILLLICFPTLLVLNVNSLSTKIKVEKIVLKNIVLLRYQY